MNHVNEETDQGLQEFDFSLYEPNALIHERRTGRDRRSQPPTESPPPRETPQPLSDRRAKKDRRRRIDPTTFEKQYTVDELEFMNAMQRFKELSGKAFPTYGEVLRVAVGLGYRREVADDSSVTGDEPISAVEP
jgi:hypothetical protein